MNEEQSPRRQYSKKSVLLLIVVIGALTGVLIFQQIQISYLLPRAQQALKTEASWDGFGFQLYASQIGAVYGNNSEAPSLVVVPTNNNSNCLSISKSCDGYDYYFAIENVCQNTTYYGTCNLTGGEELWWYDVMTNVLFVTGGNVNVAPSQTGMIYGNWPKNSSVAVGNLMILQVSTGLGWTEAPMAAWD